MLANVDVPTERAQRPRSRVLGWEVQDVEPGTEGSRAGEQRSERLTVAVQLEDATPVPDEPDDGGRAVDSQPARPVLVRERGVCPLPRLGLGAAGTDPGVSLVRVALVGLAVAAVERPDLDLADVLVAERLVERSACVFSTITSSQTRSTARARASSCAASMSARPVPRRRSSGTTPRPADPGVGAAQAEIDETDRSPVAHGDA